MSDKVLKEIGRLLAEEHSRLVAKMIEDRNAGRGYADEDRQTLLKLNEAIALLKRKMAPPPESWVEQVIKQMTGRS